MKHEALVVSPGPAPGTVRLADGTVRRPPEGWALLPPGDAGLTRRVKAAGPSWTVKERVRRREVSRGVWAPAANLEAARERLEEERGTEAWQKRLEAGRERRERKQEAYVEDFRGAVLDFLAFPPVHAGLARRLAEAVTAHATPVGSGTVARTERIPVERRAEAAVIAWLRHQTTGYDDLVIPRVKGKRREVRRRLAERGRELLDAYRRGHAVPPGCPLARALS